MRNIDSQTTYDKASKVCASKETDLPAKFGVAIAADKDAAGKVTVIDYGISGDEMRDIASVMRDIDKDPRDIDDVPFNPGIDTTDDDVSERTIDVSSESAAYDVLTERIEKMTAAISAEYKESLEQERPSDDEILDRIEAAIANGEITPPEDVVDITERTDTETETTNNSDSLSEDENLSFDEISDETSTDIDGDLDADDENYYEDDVDYSNYSNYNYLEAEVEAHPVMHMSDDEFKEYVLEHYGDTSEEDAIIGELSLQRDEYLEAIEIIRENPDEIDQGYLNQYFTPDESTQYMVTDEDGDQYSIAGPPTEEDWKAFEQMESDSLRGMYIIDVDENGLTRYNEISPPDDAFWDAADKISPDTEIPYRDTDLADVLNERVQGYYAHFDREISSNAPAYTEHMEEYSDHIKDVNCNRLPDDFQMPTRECATADEWKELQIERYTAVAETVLTDVGFEKDNLNAYIDAHSYRAFEDEGNLQFVYDNVGEEEYDNVMREYNQCAGRIEYLDQLESTCQHIVDISGSDIDIDAKISSMSDSFERYFSPEILAEVNIERPQEDIAFDTSTDQGSELSGVEVAQEVAVASPDTPIELTTIDVLPTEQAGIDVSTQPETLNLDNGVDTSVVAEGAIDGDEFNEAASDISPPNDTLTTEPPILTDEERIAAVDSDEDDTNKSSHQVDLPDLSDNIAAAELVDNYMVENENTSPEDGKDARDIDGKDERDTEIGAVDEQNGNENEMVSKEEIREAMDKFFDQGPDGSFSFKEDFLDLHSGQIDFAEMHEVLGEKAQDMERDIENPGSISVDEQIDRAASVLDSISDFLVSSVTSQFEHTGDLIDAFQENGIQGVFEAGLESQLDATLHKLEGLVNISDYLNEKLDPEWQLEMDALKETICDQLEFINLSDSTIDKICDVAEALSDIFHGFSAALADIGTTYAEHDSLVDAPDMQVDISAAEMNFGDMNTPQPDIDMAQNQDIDSHEAVDAEVPQNNDFAQDIELGNQDIAVEDPFRDFMQNDTSQPDLEIPPADIDDDIPEIL